MQKRVFTAAFVFNHKKYKYTEFYGAALIAFERQAEELFWRDE